MFFSPQLVPWRMKWTCWPPDLRKWSRFFSMSRRDQIYSVQLCKMLILLSVSCPITFTHWWLRHALNLRKTSSLPPTALQSCRPFMTSKNAFLLHGHWFCALLCTWWLFLMVSRETDTVILCHQRIGHFGPLHLPFVPGTACSWVILLVQTPISSI